MKTSLIMLFICVLLTGAFIVLILTPLGILTDKITRGIVRQSLKRIVMSNVLNDRRKLK